jgi:hypothetical protein
VGPDSHHKAKRKDCIATTRPRERLPDDAPLARTTVLLYYTLLQTGCFNGTPKDRVSAKAAMRLTWPV